jgi:hypothetical protein
MAGISYLPIIPPATLQMQKELGGERWGREKGFERERVSSAVTCRRPALLRLF